MDNAFVFVALIVMVIVLAMLLPRWIRRSTAKAGERADRSAAASRLEGILAELGSTVVIEASEPVVREIVDLVAAQQPRRFTVLGDGSYGIRFVEPDDAVARLVADGVGTRLQVDRCREYLGMPNTTEFWNDLRIRVAAASARQGLPTREGSRLSYLRQDGAPPVWVRDDR